MTTLVEAVRGGSPRAVARAISLMEGGGAPAAALTRALFPVSGGAFLIGITGPPGAGKSTLVDRLVHAYRSVGRRVGVLAVDPSSPYSGGAILGDRVRMLDHAADPGVFIRSMATRGHLGGVARATADAAVVMDAAGFEVVLIETVGVGQDEIEIVRTADVAILTLVPGTGDDVQALKAGVMEIADIFVINKADREGADRAAAAVEGLLALNPPDDRAWRPPVLKTVASTGQGVDLLVQNIDAFRAYQTSQSGTRRADNARARVLELATAAVLERLTKAGEAAEALAAAANDVAARVADPYSAAAKLLVRLGIEVGPLGVPDARGEAHTGAPGKRG